jgi:alkaline phosphatase
MKRMAAMICVFGLFICACTPEDTQPTSPGTGPGLRITTPTAQQQPGIQDGQATDSAPNVILMIGDGMGEVQRTAAQWFSLGQETSLVMDSLPVHGWAHTSPIEGGVTDSAASATAYATGQKTYINYLSVNAAGDDLTTILEYAQRRGMAVGLVGTRYISDATTAAFASHVPDRVGMRSEIASQMLAHRVDVILGGGESDFLPRDQIGCYPDPGSRDDGRNLIEEAIAAGYEYVCDAASFASIDVTGTDHLLGLFADNGMASPYSPSLADMTQKAIDILSRNPHGFFLLVEGSFIDLACHWNDAQWAMTDTVGLDEAVAAAHSFAESDGNTLVIVTADHETGGMSLSETPSGLEGEDGPFSTPDGQQFYVNWATGNHTGADVPVTAYGPGAEMLDGTYENTRVFEAMVHALELELDVVEPATLDTFQLSFENAQAVTETMIGEVEVEAQEDFTSYLGSQYLAANYQAGAESIKIIGDGTWSSYWTNNNDHAALDASLIRFRFSDSADFVMGYAISDFGQQDYCFWGSNEEMELFQMQFDSIVRDQLEGGAPGFAPDWYYALFIIGEHHDSLLRIWGSSSPSYAMEARFTFGSDQALNCADRGWWFTVSVGEGWVEIDEYVHFATPP